jgi:hypothetical protein
MARLTFEEQGLLRILERIQAGNAYVGPSVRFALVQRELIEAGEPAALTDKGERVLEELRLRPVRMTGEFPVIDVGLGKSSAA